MMWISYKEKIAALSEKIVEAQKPIRVLDAIKWDPSIEVEFFRAKGKELPKVDAESYKSIPLGFDPERKTQELSELKFLVEKTLGKEDDIGGLLLSMVEQYREVVVMLAARGTPAFYRSAKILYGSPKDTFFNGQHSIMDQGKQLYGILSSLESKFLGREYPKNLSSEDVVAELQARFSRLSV
jgi:hypothetical protein